MKNIKLLLFLFLLPSWAMALPITNPSFESGTFQGWSAWNGTGQVSIVKTNVRTGSYAVQVSGREASIEQIVAGLSPNTTYTLSAWVKCTTGAGMWVGVKDYGGTETSVVAKETQYTKKQIVFTTGATNTTAKIYFYRHPNPIYGNTGLAWGDDFEVTKVTKLDLGITNNNILKVYETAANFSLNIRPTITQGAVDNTFKLWYYWKDFYGTIQGKTDLKLNTNNTILPPQNTSNKKYFSLIFETNNPNVLLPHHVVTGGISEFGVCFLTKTPTTSRIASNNYPLGTLHFGDPVYDDPYMPSMVNRNQKMEGFNLTYYTTETNRLISKGIQPIGWVARQEGHYWNWKDDKPITTAQLSLLEQQMEAFFRANTKVTYWEVGWEENVHWLDGMPLLNYPYYWANLKKKVEAVRRAANKVNTNIKFCYQLSTVNPKVDAVPFFTSGAAALYDVLAFHSYQFKTPVSPENWLTQAITDVKAMIQQYRPTMELWITEIGLPNDPASTDPSINIPHLTVKEASLYMAKSIVMSLSNDVKKVMWYNYYDKCDALLNIECQFGMIDYWGFPRASYATFYTLLKNVRDKTFKRKINTGFNNVYAYEFEDNTGALTTVAWTYPAGTTTLPLTKLGILNATRIKEVLGTEGSAIALVQGTNMAIPDYPIFINALPSCPVVTPSVKSKTATSITLQWIAQTSASGYELQYRKKGTTTWTIKTLTGATINNNAITGLTKSTTYEMRMRAKCTITANTSVYSKTIETTTPAALVGDETASLIVFETVDIPKKDNTLVVYPNPTNGEVTLQINSAETGIGQITVRDYLGRQVLKLNDISLETGEQRLTIDLSKFNNGVYFIHLINGDFQTTEKILLHK